MNHLSKAERTFILIVLIGVAFLATGCTHVRPYAELGLAYQIDENTDYWLEKDRSWQCSDGLQGQLEVGAIKQWKNSSLRLGYHHESWLNCGKPLGNKEPEVYQDDVRLVYQKIWR